MRLRTWIILGTLPITLPVGYMVIGTIILSLLGYYPDAIGWQVAEQLAKTGGKGEECMKIVHLIPHILSPTQGEQRATCLYTLAELIKDPAACAYLMPSDYGMSCIAAATNFPQQECIENPPKSLLCYDPQTKKQSIYNVPQIENCAAYKKYNNHQVIHWCYGQRAKNFGELNACLADATKPAETDDCYYQRAMKLDDLRLDLCAKIESNELMRKDCSATVSAWIKYPKLRPQM